MLLETKIATFLFLYGIDFLNRAFIVKRVWPQLLQYATQY